jgi:HKD family nuclease
MEAGIFLVSSTYYYADRSQSTLLPDGLYERVIDAELKSQLDSLTREIDTSVLDDGDSNVILARYLQRILEGVFEAIPHSDRLQKQIDAANSILDLLRRELPSTANMMSALTTEKLLEIRAATRPALPRPSAGLVASSLLTGTSSDPSLSSLLKQELQSADRVDILCAFVKWSGIRLIENKLRSFCNTHDKEPEPALRVIATTYMGATDERAVTALTNLPSTGVRVSYDTHSTRLHAKAYLFYRNSGFSTAYVGSSNISAAALTDGLEWNTRISEAETPHLWQKVVGTFETYWHLAEMVPYYLGDQNRLADALIREKLGEPSYEDGFRFEIRPYPFQEEVLERLLAER